MTTYDVAVVGGGIHGVGVAQAAAASGYRTVLLERTALAAGTSSRSSKLIHGGLRYLESLQLGLVRESLQERRTLLKIAPTLVKPTRFFIPVYRQTSRRPWMIRAGLLLYALLAGFQHRALFHRVGRSDWRQLDGLSLDNLQKVFCYWDAQTDDVKLTEAVMRSAQSLGAELRTPAEVTGVTFDGNYYRLHYRIDDEEMVLRCRTLVNATGPWANHVLNKVTPIPQLLDMDLVQGSHIVLAGKTERGVYYLEAPTDHRAVFVMPWYGRTLVGTTEKHFEGDPAKVVTTREEVDYLLATYRHYFPGRDTTIVERFAGLRVLPRVEGEAFHRPRDTTLHECTSHPGLVTIYGGKLTGYRATAEKVLRRLRPVLGPGRSIADTRKLILK